MHSKTRIAVLIAALVVGAQAGIAAVDEVTSTEPVRATELAPVQQAQAAPAALPESVAPAAQTPAPAPAKSAEPSMTSKIGAWFSSMYDKIAAAFRSGSASVAAATTTVLSATTSPSEFPMGSDSGEEWKPLPAQRAYLEQLEQQRAQLAAAPRYPFPMGSDSGDEWKPLPAQLAYFERLEQQRLASVQPAAVGSSAQAGSGDLLMAHQNASGETR